VDVLWHGQRHDFLTFFVVVVVVVVLVVVVTAQLCSSLFRGKPRQVGWGYDRYGGGLGSSPSFLVDGKQQSFG